MRAWFGETERKNDDREREREKRGTDSERGKEGSAQAYLLFLASSLPPPLADAEGVGRSDDVL